MDNLWIILVGGISTPLKNMSSSIGMMTFPIHGKIKVMFQTTKQKPSEHSGCPPFPPAEHLETKGNMSSE